MSHRLTWWLLPPLLVIGALFTGAWGVGGMRAQAAELLQQQQARQHADQQAAQAASAAQAQARQQFSLEIRSVGITIDRYRQMQVWQQLDQVNQPQKSILSQNPNDYEWAADTRSLQSDNRAANAFENAVRSWVERWPIPVLVADATGMGTLRLALVRQDAGLGIHLFTGLGAHKGEGADTLVQQLFQVFDENPELPAVVMFSDDSQENQPNCKDARFVPTLPDSMVAILVTRTDRVNQFIRPYTVDVPYAINMDDTQYDVIKLWNFYWDQDTAHDKIPNSSDTMPSHYWNEKAKTLIAQVDANGSQGGLLPFWNNSKAGFKPSPWVPVRWTKWQLEDEYDRAPIVGHLHRPIEVNLAGKNETQKAEAMAQGWKQALATLPDGSDKPTWLFYDPGTDGKQVIPLSRAMSQDGTPEPIDLSDHQHSYDLSTRIGNTGVSSPFVQLGLATMRSYHHGGVSATVNLRQPDRASIILVSPPTAAEKAHNQPNPNDPHYDPNDPNPFVNRVR